MNTQQMINIFNEYFGKVLEMKNIVEENTRKIFDVFWSFLYYTYGKLILCFLFIL